MELWRLDLDCRAMARKHRRYIRESNQRHEGGRDVLQMHHIGTLRKHSQAVDDNVATCLHPGGLRAERRREDHWRVACPAQSIGEQFHHRLRTRKVCDKKIGDQYSQIVT